MPAPATIDDFLEVVRKSNQVDPGRLEAYLHQHRGGDTLPPDPRKFAALLVREGILTNFQAEQFLQGRYRGFQLGGYRIIERLGAGGTGTVYLAEHEVMKRRVALKVLPAAFAADPAVLERFRREAQAAAALDHPNIVRAYDFRHEGQLHFLVMEYVNGPSLEQVLQGQGPLPVGVACEYARQAAVGLQHAHEAGLVHRDVKPGNLLVDPSGIVKILDMGLARFSPEGQESVTRQFDENAVMGTADYLAPEQAINLHNVDSRADIYSLGATLYALLAGRAPFAEGTVTQKLLWHQMRDPTPLDEVRPDVPPEVADLVAGMMAKDPERRYQTAAEVAEALEPYSTATPTPQGPARPGQSNGTGSSPYVRANRVGPVTAARRMNVPGADAYAEQFPRSLGLPDDEDDRDEEPARRREPEPRGPAAEDPVGVMGVLLLGGVITTVLLLVGGVIAFLVFGPSPTATSVPDPEEELPRRKPGPSRPAAQPPGPSDRLPDVVGVVRTLRGHPRPLERVAFMPDGKRLAVSCRDGIIYLWDVLAGRRLTEVRGHSGEVFFVSFTANGSQLLSCGADGTARLSLLPEGRQFKLFPHQKKGRAWCAVFGRSEDEVLTAGDDGVLRLWDARSGQKQKDMPGHTKAINGLAYRPGKGHQAVTASWDNTLRLWDLDKGQTVRTLRGHSDRCASVAVTPDGRTAVSGGYDATVRLWDLDSGKNVHTFPGHDKQVWIVAVSPDGRRALSGGIDRKVRLWDLVGRRLEHTYDGHAKEVTGLAFTPDGRHFASCSVDQTVRVWGLPPRR
jgi:WD40 repeat protein/serine/threonine protein kinase